MCTCVCVRVCVFVFGSCFCTHIGECTFTFMRTHVGKGKYTDIDGEVYEGEWAYGEAVVDDDLDSAQQVYNDCIYMYISVHSYNYVYMYVLQIDLR